MEATHIQEYRVRDLPTRSITLFPTRAQVVRDIRDVILKVCKRCALPSHPPFSPSILDR